MKKRLLIIGLALVMAMTALMPAPVLAAPGQPGYAAKPFKADGIAAVNIKGNIIDYETLGKNFIVIKRVGEGIGGQIISSPDWPEFDQAVFQITENATTVLNLPNSKFSSEATGTILVWKSGVLCMTGKYEALMHGDFDPASATFFTKVVDYGQIRLEGITETIFDGVTVKGTVSATLIPTEIASGVWTLAGPISIQGTHTN